MKIELIKWSEENKGELVKICNLASRTYLSGRLPYPYTEADADFWLNSIVYPNEGKRGIFRAIVCDGEIVGNITIEPKEDIRIHDSEIGYFVIPELWGRGIATEATRLICELAFSVLNITRITSMVFSENAASCAVLLKNGFTHEGTMKAAAYKDGKYFDIMIFGRQKKG